jgi:hypothetical protein
MHLPPLPAGPLQFVKLPHCHSFQSLDSLVQYSLPPDVLPNGMYVREIVFGSFLSQDPDDNTVPLAYLPVQEPTAPPQVAAEPGAAAAPAPAAALGGAPAAVPAAVLAPAPAAPGVAYGGAPPDPTAQRPQLRRQRSMEQAALEAQGCKSLSEFQKMEHIRRLVIIGDEWYVAVIFLSSLTLTGMLLRKHSMSCIWRHRLLAMCHCQMRPPFERLGNIARVTHSLGAGARQYFKRGRLCDVPRRKKCFKRSRRYLAISLRA